MSKLRVLDLFSGIGGFSLGLEAAGFETVAFCEISPKCRRLLAYHWPHVPAFEDITKLTGDQVGPVDAICGGFPCQDISTAGKGAGIGGERSGLWRHYARLIGELRPRVVIVENVAALLGRGLGDVLGDLAALGYDAWWDCIPACAVGAPHRRDRIWIVAYPGGEQHEGYGEAVRRSVATQLSSAALANAYAGLHAGELAGGQDPRQASGGEGGDSGEGETLFGEWLWSEPGPSGAALADAIRVRQQGSRVFEDPRNSAALRGWETTDVVDGGVRGFWTVEPDVGRVAHGIPARMDRLHGLGNAVVPQIPEIIGRAILEGMAA